jgi:hypothetical protein
VWLASRLLGLHPTFTLDPSGSRHREWSRQIAA